MSQKENPYNLKNIIKIADSYVNADTSTIDGISRMMQAWFCLEFNTTLNDERLQSMTLEELMLEYFMRKVHNNINYIYESGAKEYPYKEDDYEEWLKEEMGNEYVTDEEMTKLHEDELPEIIETSFPSFEG